MSDVPWERVRPLLERCLDLSEAELEAYLAEACDAETAAWVRRLLDSEVRTGKRQFLESPFSPGTTALDGRRLGPWRLLEQIGEGGMGTVWRGERADGAFEKSVAIKLLKPGLGLPEFEQRFETEVRILASFEHPSIVRLLDGGRTEEHMLYLVLELVTGEPIDHWCDARRLVLRERVELFLQVCEATQHAHEHGVLHRDLKPANVLVDADGRARLLDFGIARAIGDAEGPGMVDATRTGQRLYTPRYASPEQVCGEEMSAPSDVYSLGVMLYELLVGQPPFSLESPSQFELERAVLDIEPRRPSRAPRQGTGYEDACTLRGMESTEDLCRGLGGDLDWILLTALRKEPERRYSTVTDLAEDLRRFLEDRPVLARPDSRVYRAKRFVRRHRRLVTVSGTLGLALFVALLTALLMYSDSERMRGRSESVGYVAALGAALAGIEGGDPAAAREVLETQPEGLRGWEWRHAYNRLDRSLAHFPDLLPLGQTHCMAVSPTGDSVLVGTATSLHRVDVGEGRVTQGVDVRYPRAAAYGPSGEDVAISCEDGTLRMLSAGTGHILRTFAVSDERLFSCAYSPSGDLLAWADYGGAVGLIDPKSGAEHLRFQAHGRGEITLEFSPDGRRLASASWDKAVRVWDTQTGALEHELLGHERWVTDAAWTPDGQRLISTSIDETVRVWSLNAGDQAVQVFRPHRGTVLDVEPLADGEHALSVGFGGEVLRWELETGKVVARFIGHEGQVSGVRTHQGGVITLGLDGVRLWSMDTQDIVTRETCEYTSTLAIADSGDRVSCAGPDGVLRTWSPTGEPLGESHLPRTSSPDIGHQIIPCYGGDDLVIVGVEENGVSVRKIGEARPAVLLEGVQGLADVRWGPAGLVIVAQGCYLIDADFAVRELRVPGDGAGVDGLGLCAAVSLADGEIAIADESGRVHRFRAPDGSYVETLFLPQSTEAISAISYCPEGRFLSIARGSRWIEWDLERAGDPPREVHTPTQVNSIAYHPSEPRLVLGMASGKIKVIDRKTTAVVATLPGHRESVGDLAFLPGGHILISASAEGTVRFWNGE